MMVCPLLPQSSQTARDGLTGLKALPHSLFKAALVAAVRCAKKRCSEAEATGTPIDARGRVLGWLKQLQPAMIAASPRLLITIPWLHPTHRPESTEQMLVCMEQYVPEQPQVATSWEEPQS